MMASEICVQLFEVVGCLARKCWWAPALRGAAAARWWAGRALKLWVWPTAGGAAVDVFTALLFDAPALVEPPAYLSGWHWLGYCRLGNHRHGPYAHLREPPQEWPVGILGACILVMVVLKAERAPPDRLGSSCKCLIVEACIWHRPIEILPRQGFPPVATVIRYPLGALVIPFCADDRCLIG